MVVYSSPGNKPGDEAMLLQSTACGNMLQLMVWMVMIIHELIIVKLILIMK